MIETRLNAYVNDFVSYDYMALSSSLWCYVNGEVKYKDLVLSTSVLARKKEKLIFLDLRHGANPGIVGCGCGLHRGGVETMFSGRSMVKWKRVTGWCITLAFFGPSRITGKTELAITHHLNEV